MSSGVLHPEYTARISSAAYYLAACAFKLKSVKRAKCYMSCLNVLAGHAPTAGCVIV